MPKKQALTLLEMVLVMALVSIALGTLAFKIPQALRVEKFESSLQRLLAKLELAEEWVLNYQTDIHLHFEKEKEHLRVVLEPQIPLTSPLAELNRYSDLEGIHSVSFNKQPLSSLVYDASIGATPTGELTIQGKNQEATLILKGYPGSIVRKK